MEKKKKIGLIGQGWIGKNYADDFEKRGFDVVRYTRSEPYVKNKDAIGECDIVFIAVPTPTTPEGFDDSVLRSVIPLVGEGKTAVIKSTLVPGTTEAIQKDHTDIFIMHSPEFLTEVTAAHDAAHPNRNIVGIPVDDEAYREKAKEVLVVLPSAPHELICGAKEAELIKYAGNIFLYFKVIYANLLYDLARGSGIDYESVKNAIAADPRIDASHLDALHASGHVGPDSVPGRGAGGHCFIKDFAAFSEMYKEAVGDELGMKVLEALKDKNVDLLTQSGKDLDLLEGVYGKK